MGAYLAAPLTDKESTDEANEYLACGASQMQGWRMTQEDAHICELSFDKDKSLFAVFDGHGGSEVALYCSQKLPAFLKAIEAYKKGEYEQALKDAFIGFDATLVSEEVIEELKKLIPDKDNETDTDEEADEDEENLNELCNEGHMPLNELLQKLKDPNFARVKQGESSGSSKPLSPFLRGRRNGSSSSSAATENGECSSASDSTAAPKKLDSSEEEAVSSSSASVDKKDEATNSVTNGPSSSGSGSGSNVDKDAVKKNGNGPSSSEGASSSETVEPNSCNSPDSSSNAKKAEEESKNQKDSSSSSSLEEEDSDDSDHDEEDDDEAEDEEEDADTEDEEDSDDHEEEFEEDEKFLNNMHEGPGSSSGCTAVVALLSGNDLYVANAGDSRCVVCRDGEAVDMSFDHKPEDTEELERIRKAGGRVTVDGRVNGGLNLSRAIGDHAYKTNKDLKAEEQMISALPDVKRIALTPKDEFMILACDGIWNSLSSEEVVNFVRKRIQNGETKMSAICEELFTTCLAPDTCGDGTGCDNMTAVIVQLKPTLTQKFQSTGDCADDEITSRKRQASPTSNNDELNTESSKRLKTEG